MTGTGGLLDLLDELATVTERATQAVSGDDATLHALLDERDRLQSAALEAIARGARQAPRMRAPGDGEGLLAAARVTHDLNRQLLQRAQAAREEIANALRQLQRDHAASTAYAGWDHRSDALGVDITR